MSNETLGSLRFPATVPQFSAPGGLLLGDLTAQYPAEMEEWKTSGSTTLPGILTWWANVAVDEHPEATTAQVAEVELRMYQHHAADPDSALQHMRHSSIQQLIRQDKFLYRLAVTLRGDHAWRLTSIPSLMNEVEAIEVGTIPEFMQLAVPFPDDGKWAKGEVLILSREESQEVPENQCTLLPCFVAIKDNKGTLELPEHTASDMEHSHRLLTTPGRTVGQLRAAFQPVSS